MKLAAKTDIGYGRLENQDNYRAARLPDDTVWGLICDGMGGANSGKLASQLAAQALEEYFDQGLADLVPGQEIEFLRKAVQQANQAMQAQQQQYEQELSQLDNLFNRTYYSNMLDRSDVRGLLSDMREQMATSTQALKNQASVTGATSESITATQKAQNQAYGKAVSQVASLPKSGSVPSAQYWL